MSGSARDIAYTIPWRSSGIRAGAHKSHLFGAGGRFRDIVPLLTLPDPRRIAIRASLSDPFERLLVRRTEQQAAVDVCLLIDVSGSMSFTGNCNKLTLAADLAEALAVCAERTGDSFALYPFDITLRHELVLRRSFSKAAHAEAVARLRVCSPDRPGVIGALEAAAAIAGSKKLVFIISDFLWSMDDARRIGGALSSHDVVPIEIEDSLQSKDLPDWGLLNLKDLESGRHQLVVMRPSLKERWLRQEHRRCIRQVFDATARQMFSIRDRIDWMQLTSYLLYGSV
jgi:uncharacterized protein (DUF58 family)